MLDRVAALDRPAVKGLRWTTRDQWHVTLRFLGRVDDVDAVRSALQAVAFAPTPVSLGPALGRFGQRILHVPVSGVELIASAVVQATADLGEPPEDRPFRGHITLARVARDADVDLRRFAGTAVDGAWQVDSVCLVESHLNPAGARYEVLGRFPPTA